MRRLLAVLAAVAMVALALWGRSVLDDDDGGGGSRSGSGEARVVCATELAEACTDLGEDATVVVEEAGVTADRLAAEGSSDAGFDAWLVPLPWPAMVDLARQQVGLPPVFEEDPEVLASSPIAAVGPPGDDGCDWRCLGERVGAGDLELRWRDPATTATGLLALGAATAGYFDGPDVAVNDFDADFQSFLSGLLDGAETHGSPVDRLLQEGIEAVAVSWQADAGPTLAGASADRRDRYALLYPEPVAVVEVALAGAGGPPDGDLAGRMRDSLVAAGWEDGGAGEATLPSAGVLLNLRAEAAG